jgi:hypothetical protein
LDDPDSIYKTNRFIQNPNLLKRVPIPGTQNIFSQRTGTNHKSNQAREEQSGNLDSFEETDWQHPLGCSGGKLQQLYGLISWDIIRITMVKYHLYNKSSTLQQW